MNIGNKDRQVMNNFGLARFLSSFVASEFDGQDSQNRIIAFLPG
jgi:hypothetical protein